MVENKVTGNRQEPRVECDNASIVINGVSKNFGKIRALDKVDLNVRAGGVFALLGPNGSGKTTLVRVLTTLLKPQEGSATVGGYDVVKEPNSVRNIIGLAGQYPAVDENLTGKENLVMIGRLYHIGTRKATERAVQLLETFDLVDAGGRNVKTYSGGMRRRLDLAAAIVAEPPILFLDEPTSGLDPRSRLGLWDVISSQAKNCKTVLLTTQYLEEADKLAGQIAIMDRGRIVRVGTPQELKKCCGGDDLIKLRVLDRQKTLRVSELLQEMGNGSFQSDAGTGEISLAATEGTVTLNKVINKLKNEQIELAEIGLTQPTLDNVFLSITGHTTDDADKTAAAKNSRRPEA